MEETPRKSAPIPAETTNPNEPGSGRQLSLQGGLMKSGITKKVTAERTKMPGRRCCATWKGTTEKNRFSMQTRFSLIIIRRIKYGKASE